MNTVNIISDLRLSPWFLEAFYAINNNLVAIPENNRS
jgi:hypothetical protein